MKELSKRFKNVAVGGTFDEFHKGHRALLKTAFEISEKVVIGLCTDYLVENLKKPHEVAPFAVRLEELKGFLIRNSWLDRAEIVPLHDPYGPAATSKLIEAIVVSQETKDGAQKINQKRKAKDIPPLHIIIIEMVLAEKSGPISTTRIRRLEIDHEGRLLSHSEIFKD